MYASFWFPEMQPESFRTIHTSWLEVVAAVLVVLVELVEVVVVVVTPTQEKYRAHGKRHA